MTPCASLANLSATGDVVVGPGMPLNLVNGIPVACMGDAVAGVACVGVVTVSTAINHLTKGRPVANLGSVITGVNPVLGVPMVTALALCPHINRIV